MRPNVTVVLDPYGDYRRPDQVDVPFEDALRSLQAQTYPKERITFLATCSTPEVPHIEPLLATVPRLRMVVVPEGHGYYQKKNFGAQHAEGDFVLFADGDCIYPENWVAEMVTAFERGGERVAAVQGMSRFCEGPGARLLDVLYWTAYRPEGPLHQIYSAHNLAMRRELVSRFGFEDTPLRAGLERTLSSRIREAGLLIWHNRQVTVTHESSHGRREFWEKAIGRGHYRMLLWQLHPNRLDRALLPLGYLGVPLYVFLVGLRDTGRQFRGLRERGLWGPGIVKLPWYILITWAWHIFGGVGMIRVLRHMRRTRGLPEPEIRYGQVSVPDHRGFSTPKAAMPGSAIGPGVA